MGSDHVEVRRLLSTREGKIARITREGKVARITILRLLAGPRLESGVWRLEAGVWRLEAGV